MYGPSADIASLCLDDGAPSGHALLEACRLSLNGADGAALAVHLLRFDAARFRPAAFGRTHIRCPPSVARGVGKRQAEFFFGRLAARMALSDAMGNAIAAIPIEIGAAREPVWPAGVVGSISHSTVFAAASVQAPGGPRRGIGIDVERVIDAATQASLSGLVIDAAELACLHRFTHAWPLPTLLTVAFSAKESFYKGAFGAVGRFFDFKAARVVKIDPDRRRLQLVLTQTLAPEFLALQQCEVGFDFIAPETVLTHFTW